MNPDEPDPGSVECCVQGLLGVEIVRTLPDFENPPAIETALGVWANEYRLLRQGIHLQEKQKREKANRPRP